MLKEEDMGLQEKLNELRAQVESDLSREAVAMMHRATDELRASGILEGVLKVGEKAPEFSLPNVGNDIVSSRELLEKGNLVVSFYRGVW